MTTNEWIARARQHADALRSLVINYHPASGGKRKPMPITARAAEKACAVIRTGIAREQKYQPEPIHRLDTALVAGDASEIISLLNSAWFGVPESTSCWGITGFREAVSLLEDVPEDDGEADQ